MKKSDYDDTKSAIEATTDYSDMFLQDIANQGPNNVLNNHLTESANLELQNLAKKRIAELEKQYAISLGFER